ncbi:MAG: hypothetical protein ABGZ53_22915 [Fuerstiella sp.]
MTLLGIIVVAVCCLVFISWLVEKFGPKPEYLNQAYTDDDFLAAVPDANPESALRVRSLISDQLGIPVEHIHPDYSFVDDYSAG